MKQWRLIQYVGPKVTLKYEIENLAGDREQVTYSSEEPPNFGLSAALARFVRPALDAANVDIPDNGRGRWLCAAVRIVPPTEDEGAQVVVTLHNHIVGSEKPAVLTSPPIPQTSIDQLVTRLLDEADRYRRGDRAQLDMTTELVRDESTAEEVPA